MSRSPVLSRSIERRAAALTIAVWVGAAALAPLFGSWHWYPSAAAGAAVVITTGLIARVLGWPVAFIPVLQGLSLLVVTAELFARDHLWAGFLPTGATVTDLRRLLDAGLQTADTATAPVAVTAGIAALTMIGVGLLALLVDVLALTLSAGVATGAAFLALFIAPAYLVPGGAPWWSFAAAACGWLIVLSSDAREAMRRWGQPIGEPAPLHARGGSARRIGVVAVAVALLVPIAIPALADPIVLGRGPGFGPATGSGVTVSPLASLKRDYLDGGDRQLLTVTADPARRQYLRMITLNRFDGQTWSAVEPEPQDDRELNAGLPRTVAGLAGQGSLAVRDFTIRIGDLDGPYAPMPQPAVRQTIGGGWFYDPESDSVFSRQFSSRRTVYTVSALDVNIDAATMRARAEQESQPPAQPDVEVPSVIAETARRVTAGADNRFDQALALQNWFRSSFRYSTTVRSGSDSAYLEQFLTERVGYCEQFAATMALMARSLGIPSRVAVGFAPGQATADGWTVSARDAHAWPELWMPGTGWTSFEPTPRADPGSGVTTPAYASGGATSTPTAVPSASSSASASERTPRGPDEEAGAADVGSGTSGGAIPWPVWVLTGLVVVALLAAIPAGVRLARRRRRLGAHDPQERLRGAWRDLAESTVDYGRVWSPAATPRQCEQALVPVIGAAAAPALARLRSGFEASVYSAATGREWERSGSELGEDLRAVRAGLAARLTRTERVRTLIWPRSVVSGGQGLRQDELPDEEVAAGQVASATARRGGGSSDPRPGP